MPESANEHLDVLEKMIRENNPATILDVGMGRGNYGWFLRNKVGYKGKLVGLEVWAPYVVGPEALAGGNRTYYDEILVMDVRHAREAVVKVKPDTVFAFDVIEHLRRDEGVEVLRMLQNASLRDVLVSVPVVAYPQGPIHGNPHEAHQHDWSVTEMLGLGSELRHRGTVTGLFEFPGGGCDRRMTVTLNTVRERDPREILDDLVKQTFREFEVVIVDGLHEHRAEMLAEHGYPFRVLHVPPRPTAMVRDRRCAISAYKNTGLAHARGEIVVTLDDCCRIDPGFLQRCWDAWAHERVMLSALYREHGGTDIPDSRTLYLDAMGRCTGPVRGDPNLPPMYGFATIAMQAAIAVNGYDEMYDGSQGLEDADMGIRLQRAGHRIRIDRTHVVELLPQGPWSTRVFGNNLADAQVNVKCCQTTLRIQLARGHVRANESTWSDEDWAKVAPRCYLLTEEARCSLNGHPCPYVGLCSDREHPSLRLIREEPPQFDLRRLRVEHGIR